MNRAMTPHIEIVPVRSGNAKRALFGYHIPHLPDLLSDHTLLGNTDRERVAEILSRWTQTITGLRKWRRTAFALRYLAHPSAGAIDVAVLGRLIVSGKEVQQAAEPIATELAAQLTSLGFPYQALDRATLRSHLLPFESAPALVEVRQHEEVTPFLTVNQDAYVIHPFWAPSGSWGLPFEAMLRQPAPTAVSLYLEPTELTQEERGGMIQAAHVAQTLAEQDVKTYSDTSVRRRRDPQAELVGRIYATLLKQLAEPFLLLVQVASPNPSAAWTVARSLGAAITAGAAELAVATDEAQLPTGFDVRAPSTGMEQRATRRTFAQLVLTPWGNDLASAGKGRLPYLVGAKGAASAFRFPISVRGGVPGIAVRQPAPDFEPGPRPPKAAIDELHLGTFRRGGAATVKLDHLARHALVTGFTGAGKTNTVLYLLNQLWAGRKRKDENPIPFLVIEAAKKEYRGLADQPGFDDLLVFTLGDETTSPFRLNPFELLPGVRLEAHLARLQTCFDAALPQFGILPSIIAETLEEVYNDKGWKLTDRGGANQDLLFPTMRDMLAKVIQVAESRGYAGETYHNIRAAAAGRIGSLLRGSRGRMFTCQRSVPLEVMMTRPTVLELNDLSQQDKSLTMMFLLMLVREYRELHKGKCLRHVTVVEEAHNVMENVQSVGASEIAADTRAKAVEAFAAMLSEVRAYGEGMIISDQSPEKLAPDAVRNTNVQIAHQLRHRTDREAISAAMIMDEAQQEYLGKLRVGEAAVFLTGYDRATFMRVPNYKDEVGFEDPQDAGVAAHMRPFRDEHLSAYLPFDGCRYCRQPCEHREAIEPYTLNKDVANRFQVALRRFEEHPEPACWEENWKGVAAVCGDVAREAGHPTALDAAWCYLAHEIDFAFTKHMRDQFERATSAIKGG